MANTWEDVYKEAQKYSTPNPDYNKGQAAPSYSGPAPQKKDETFKSPDGLLTYNSRGQLLDSLGHIAYGSLGSMAAQLAAGPVRPLTLGLTDANGMPLRAPSYAFDGGQTNWVSPGGPGVSAQLPFANGNQDPVPWAGLSDPQFQRALSYYNSALQQQQQAQNAVQYWNDFSEAKRRYDQEFPWQKARDAYSVAGAAFLPSSRFLAS